jgi:hypothetical protein
VVACENVPVSLSKNRVDPPKEGLAYNTRQLFGRPLAMGRSKNLLFSSTFSCKEHELEEQIRRGCPNNIDGQVIFLGHSCSQLNSIANRGHE